MSYKEELSKIVKKSRMTLSEIAEKCKELGVDISPSYISRLQTGKQPPASDEVNKAIATACKSENPNILVYLGYIEKAPNYMLTFFDHFIGASIQQAAQMLNSPDSDLFQKELEKVGKKKIVAIFINQIIEEPDTIAQIGKETINHLRDKYDEIMPDDSMEPLIPMNARLTIKEKSDIANDDIVLVQTTEDKKLVRKILLVNNMVFLIPTNKIYKTMIINSTDVTIIGKVKSFSVSLI